MHARARTDAHIHAGHVTNLHCRAVSLGAARDSTISARRVASPLLLLKARSIFTRGARAPGSELLPPDPGQEAGQSRTIRRVRFSKAGGLNPGRFFFLRRGASRRDWEVPAFLDPESRPCRFLLCGLVIQIRWSCFHPCLLVVFR